MQSGMWTIGAALAAVLVPALARADAYVLGKPQLGLFPAIQGAVDAASQGDTVMVEPGTYTAGFTIDGKSLTVLATHPGHTFIEGRVEVRNIGPLRRVSLTDLNVTAPVGLAWWIPPTPGLQLSDSSGVIVLQGCTFRGGKSPNRAAAGLQATNCARVLASSCTFLGAAPGNTGGEPLIDAGDGLVSVDSALALYDCAATGGKGSDESNPGGGKGGNGATVEGFGIYASGTVFRGGNGGGGDYIACTFSGDGGDGLRLSAAQAQLLQSQTIHGLANGYYSCTPGEHGQPIRALDGAVVNQHPGVRRKLEGPARGTDNAVLDLTLRGRSGDRVWLLTTYSPTFAYKPAHAAVTAIPMPWLLALAPLGVVGASGVLNVALPIGDFTEAAPARTYFFQALCVEPSGRSRMSGPLQVVLENY